MTTWADQDTEAAPAAASDGRVPRAWGQSAPVLLSFAVGAGTLVALATTYALSVAAVCVLVLSVALRPAVAGYAWLFVTPLVVGIDRGVLVPLVRPNEALLALLVVILVVRWLVLALWRPQARPVFSRLDVGFALLFLAGSVLPALWMIARGKGLSATDLQYAAVVAKYYALFVLFRLSVRTEGEAHRCLWASLTSGTVVAVLAVLQSLALFGVPDLLASYWAPAGGGLYAGRGSSTIGNPHGAADLLAFNLAIALALALRRPASRSSRAALALAPVMLLGALGSGQASGVIGVLVALLALGWVLRQLPRVIFGALLTAPLAVLALLPVIASRLAAVEPSTGLPSSWSARLDNLSTYFWPRLFDGYDWLLGVQIVPEAVGRGQGPETIHIESGHTWLLWIGGVPYLLAFAVFMAFVFRMTATAARRGSGAFAAAGAAAFSAYSTVFVLTALDPHLFLRGSADLAVPLLALTTVGLTRLRQPGAAPERPPTMREAM